MTSQARPAAICSWLSVLCIESSVVQRRSCRLVAGMHSTSFVLAWGRECGVFDPSSVCLSQTSIGFRRERGVYCRLHSQSTADTVPPPSLPVLCFVDRRDEAVEAAGKIAKSSGDSAAVPRTKGKEFFSRVTQWRWRSCESQTDNGNDQPCGLRRSPCRWCRLACCKTSDKAACMFEGQGSQPHVGFFAILACFWLVLTGKTGCQVSLTTVNGGGKKHKAGWAPAIEKPAGKVEEEGVLAFLLAIRATTATHVGVFFFWSLRAFSDLGERFESLFSYFSPCRWLREASP